MAQGPVASDWEMLPDGRNALHAWPQPGSSLQAAAVVGFDSVYLCLVGILQAVRSQLEPRCEVSKYHI